MPTIAADVIAYVARPEPSAGLPVADTLADLACPRLSARQCRLRLAKACVVLAGSFLLATAVSLLG